jgi:hypothetical protein
VYIFLQDLSRIYPKEDIVNTDRPAGYEKPIRYRELCVWCMMEVLIKCYQSKWVILGQELTENNHRK